jgi:hypothetical protein
MTDIPEDLTQVQQIIRVLEAFKKGGLNDTGARTSLDGYNIALRIMRTMETTQSINDQGDRLIRAFEEYAQTQKFHKVYEIKGCSACGQDHRISIIPFKGDTDEYWTICPVLLTPAFCKGFFVRESED